MVKERLLGRGTFGEVYSLPFETYPSEIPLCLKVPRRWPCRDPFKDAINEALRLKALEGVAGVPRLIEISVDPPGFIMTQHSSTRLKDLLQKSTPDSVLLEVLRQVSVIVHDIHKLGYLHKDIKQDNIAVHWNKGSQVHVTLLDFGSLRKIVDPESENTDKKKEWQCASRFQKMRAEIFRKERHNWIAPELYHKDEASIYSDIYSICRLLDVTLPFLTHKPPMFKQFIRKGCHRKPKHRPTLPSIILLLTPEVEKQ